MKYLLALLCALALPVCATAQPRRDAIVVFKDGFFVKGIVHESVREVIWDRASGRPFPIYSGNFFLNDHVREILFNPGQVLEVQQPKEFAAPMKVVRFDQVFQPRELLAAFEYTNFGQWDEKGERIITVRNGTKGSMEMKQRVGIITPQYIMAATNNYKWNLLYFTGEFGPDLTRKIVVSMLNEKKEVKTWTEARKSLEVAAFLQQAGWHKEAMRELEGIIENYPDAKAAAQERLTALKRDQAEQFVEGLKKAAAIGQHGTVVDGLGAYDEQELGKIVAPDLKLAAQDLRTKYDKLKTDITAMKLFLKELPARAKNAKAWTKACEVILEELNYDTANRLEEFLVSAQQYELDRKNNRELSLSLEKVLAIAVTGWLQGNQAALPDPDAALKMARAREIVLEYLKADDAGKRGTAYSEFKRHCDLSFDVMARLVRMIPPPLAHETIDTQLQTLTIEAPAGDGGSYLLQLPPDYHHLRPHPVLVLLHSGRDKSDETVQRFANEAAKQGMILVAPLWAGNAVLKTRYTGTIREQTLVLDALRDVRRRFQVDSDRVFLFGWEDGANLAFDVGLGQPDQFAGVIPMNGGMQPFTRKFYWPNAQYLPFYVVGGERDGHKQQMRDVFKDWNREPYNCIYVEYKGRASEWYGLEMAKIGHWMSKKKRYTPMKELGRANNGTALGEEFRSSRTINDRFYWLRGDGFAASTQFDHRDKVWGPKYRPATLQANLSVGNKTEKGEAKIWNQLNLHAKGMKQVTFLITPGMMDVKYPLAITLNGQQLGSTRKIVASVETMLDELHQSGDRQRLYLAKVELRP